MTFQVDRLDYLKFLSEIGLSPADMTAAAATMPTPTPRRPGEPYEVRASLLHGVGVFFTEDVRGAGRIVLQDGGEWTEAGRYANHSAEPSAAVAFEDGKIVAIPAAASAGDEMTVNYRDVRAALQ